MRAALAVATLLAIAAPAAAQSRRYPPPPIDLDAEREGYSDFWENAIEPGLDRYADLVQRASKLIGRRTDDARATAIELLTEATTLLPARADAWAWLGLAHELSADMKGCRDALERAWTIDPAWAGAQRPLGLALGTCRARAGDLEGAADVLERLIARGDDSVEALWRLGEIYMALGRLDDARAVLEVALDGSPAQTGYVHAAWALAVAADRARDPEGTRAAGEIALRLDPQLAFLASPPAGFLSPPEREFYLAVATRVADLPHRSLLHVRNYLAAVALDDEAPWAARARDHERALRSFATADETLPGGTDPPELSVARAAVRKVDADLRACVKKSPRLLLSITVVTLGPPAQKKPAPPPPRPPRQTRGKQTKPVRRPPMIPAPPAGVTVTVDEHSAAGDEQQAAVACVEKAASALVVPAPKTPGTWASVTFPVIAR
jgi:tetratricopeptide (TPR) repeat protein